MLLLLLVAQAQAPAAAPSRPGPLGIELPAGPAQVAWSAIQGSAWNMNAWADAQHARFVGKPQVWSDAAAWDAWASAAASAPHGEKPDGAERSLLALMAWSQGRSDDAWDHLATLAGSPADYVATMPFLMPGVTSMSDFASTPDSPKLALKDGVMLAPALPPPSGPAKDVVLGVGRIERRAMKITGLQIGAATVDLRVGLEYEGLQIDVEHKGGGACKLKLRLPTPLDFEIATTYIDWQRMEPPAQSEVELELKPGDEPRVVFARFEPLYVRWPTIVPDVLDSRAKENGFTLLVGANDPERARIAGFARGMELLLQTHVTVAAPALPTSTPAGIVLDLTDKSDRERKLRGLISQCERFALARKP